jgi:ferredoxin/flavodoxin---NADP+ reductase
MRRDDIPLAGVPLAADPDAPRFTGERIASIERRAPTLLYFTVSRPARYRFTPGHYARLGLGTGDDLVWRPYSIASAADDDHLAFQLTCAPGGKFTGRFCGAAKGDAIHVDRRSFGFHTVSSLAPGGTLFMLATGTGLAPYISILADPLTWTRHERTVLVHSVRHGAELAPDAIAAAMRRHGPSVQARLTVLSVVTREAIAGTFGARLGTLLENGALEKAAGCAIEPGGARVMLCGNPEMILEMRKALGQRGLATGRRGVPGQLSAEGYW